jgi:hypothetical protein
MNRSQLFGLGNYLSQHLTFGTGDERNGCDRTFRHTQAWIAEHNLDREACLGWLQQRGAWCDCGVLLEVLLFVPHELGEQTPTLPLGAFRSWKRET